MSLEKKCIWALFQIGSPAAVASLGRLTQSDDPVLASTARERLGDLKPEPWQHPRG